MSECAPSEDDESRLKEFYRTSDAYLNENIASHGEDYFRIYIERVCRHVRVGASILDLGCGTGRSSFLLAARGYHVTGVDISERYLNRSLEGEHVSLVVADAKALPFPDASFDAVACYEFIEHVFGVEIVLDEMARVVKPGGIVIVLSPNLLSPFLALRNAIDIGRGRPATGVVGRTIAGALAKAVTNSGAIILKLMRRSPSFRYRKPDLSHPEEADADSIYLANQIDIARHLVSRGLVVCGKPEGHSIVGRAIAKALPAFCGECAVVVERQK